MPVFPGPSCKTIYNEIFLPKFRDSTFKKIITLVPSYVFETRKQKQGQAKSIRKTET